MWEELALQQAPVWQPAPTHQPGVPLWKWSSSPSWVTPANAMGSRGKFPPSLTQMSDFWARWMIIVIFTRTPLHLSLEAFGDSGWSSLMQLILLLGSVCQTRPPPGFFVSTIPALCNREVEWPMFFHPPISLQGTGHYGLNPAATYFPSNRDLVSSCQGPSFLGDGVDSNLFSSLQILTSVLLKSAICSFYGIFYFNYVSIYGSYSYFANCAVSFESSSLLHHTFNPLLIF